MKIYFGFTVAGDRSSVVAATKIVELLEELGHDVLTGLFRLRKFTGGTLRGFSNVICLWLKFRAPHSAWVLRLATFWEPQTRKWFYSIGGRGRRRKCSLLT